MKAAAYSTLVRPVLEYSSTVWDPHQSSDIHNLEQVQRRAARFVHHNYTERTPGCVSNMVQSLGWESLQHRRYIDRLSMLFRVQHGLVDVTTDYIQLNDTRTRGSQRLRQLNATKDVYKYSFYPRTICDWIQLPTTVTMSRLFRNLGKTFQVCLPSSCDTTKRLNNMYMVLTGDLGHFICLSGIAVLHRVTYNLRRLLPLPWKKKKGSLINNSLIFFYKS